MFERFTFMPLHRHVQKNKFLPLDTYLDLPYWSGTDKKETFEKHLKTQPVNWHYRTHEVRYSGNSSGYRCPEWKNINWGESVIMFGCSNAYGVGLDNKDTISYRLSELINRPVINLGAGGSSIMFNLHNSVMLHEGYAVPKAVIYIWPDYSRTVEYHRHTIENFGSWNIEKNNIMDTWTSDPNHSRVHAVFAQKIAKALWKDRAPVYEATFRDGTDRVLHCHKFKYLDLARDLMHPGIKTAQLVADTIAESLKL